MTALATGSTTSHPGTLKTEKTGYQVLKLVDISPGDKAWMLIDKPIKAANAQAAIRERASTSGGTYVAIPARSWRPVTVKTETRTVVTLENA
jgi:hypothetical protein